MNLNDMLAGTPKPKCADDLLGGLQIAMTADDIGKDEKSAIALGFLIGCGYTLATSTEGDIMKAARTLMRLKSEWEAHSVL